MSSCDSWHSAPPIRRQLHQSAALLRLLRQLSFSVSSQLLISCRDCAWRYSSISVNAAASSHAGRSFTIVRWPGVLVFRGGSYLELSGRLPRWLRSVGHSPPSDKRVLSSLRRQLRRLDRLSHLRTTNYSTNWNA